MPPNNALSTVPAPTGPLLRRSRPSKHRPVSPRQIELLVEEARKLVPMFARRYVAALFDDLVGAAISIVEAGHRFDADAAKFAPMRGGGSRRRLRRAPKRRPVGRRPAPACAPRRVIDDLPGAPRTEAIARPTMCRSPGPPDRSSRPHVCDR
jgi:hypothetical protein